MISINLNDTVCVKLTEDGVIFLNSYYYNKLKNIYTPIEIASKLPKINKDGYYEMLFWEFINIFGSITTPSMELLYNPNILVKEKFIERKKLS